MKSEPETHSLRGVVRTNAGLEHRPRNAIWSRPEDVAEVLRAVGLFGRYRDQLSLNMVPWLFAPPADVAP